MKKSSFFLIALAATIFCSCNKESSEPVLTDIYFKEVGFKVEANAFLDKDYIMTDVNTKSKLDFVLSSTINPESLKKIAINTKTNEEGIEVSLEDGTVLTGCDTLDFSKGSVEIHLAKDDKFFAYTVSVIVADSEKWQEVARTAAEDTLYTVTGIAYDSSNDTYYLLNQFRRDDATKRYPVLITYANGIFSSAKVLEEVQADGNFGVAVLNGKVYVAYTDKSVSSAITVGKYDVSAGTYALLGQRGVINKTGTQDKVQVMPMADDNVYTANYSNVAGQVARRALNVSQFNNGSWTNGISIPGRAAGAYGYYNFAVNMKDCSYLSTFNQNNANYSVYKFTTSGISTVFEAKAPVVDITGTEATKCGYQAFAVVKEGDTDVLYMLCNVLADGNYKLALQKFDGNTQKLTMVGGFIPEITTTSGGIFPTLAIAADGTAYAAFQHPQAVCRPMISVMNPSTKQWSKPEALSPNECKDKPSVCIDKNGNVKVFVTFNGTGNAVVYAPKGSK